jgi:hypothetical protein
MDAAHESAQLLAADHRADPPPELVGVSWRLYKLTPLADFQPSSNALGKYGRLLASYLEAQLHRGLGVATSTAAISTSSSASGASAVVFSPLDGVAVDEGDPDAVMVTVGGAEVGANKRTGGKRWVARAVLLSVGKQQLAAPAGFTHFPLMLVKANARCSEVLFAWFAQQFDCTVSALVLSPVELVWIATEWAAPPDDASSTTQKDLE